MNNAPLQNTNVLVVDDARPPRKVLIKLLSNLGKITFFEAETISAAKILLEREEFSVIFCDHNLQDATSMSLLSWLKTTENIKNKKSPFIVISSDLDRDTVIEAKKLGAVNFLLKPFNFTDMIQVLANSLGWKQDLLMSLTKRNII